MSQLELDRERVIQTLCSHFAHDNLTTQELEVRFEHAYKAATPAELHALVAGLPALPPEFAPSAPLYAVAPSGTVPTDEKRHTVIMSNVKKKGTWTPARNNKVFCLMGSAKLDLREARITNGETLFDLNVIMGEVELIVPPGLRVECDGSAFMGEFEDVHSADLAPADAPIIRVTGSALMGAVRIKTRLPGESALAAWRRRMLQGDH
jgi:Domain of unknown function (DUF1707)/Cell wall-active antibiotics response 4TMS YvqF